MMSKLLLITPPFVQTNAPYPATAYLKGYLQRCGVEVEQCDLSIELISRIFSSDFLKDIFANYRPSDNDNCNRIHALRREYLRSIDSVMAFLKGDTSLATLICGAGFLPQASRFDNVADLGDTYGYLGTQDCARYLSTLYLQDLSDFLRNTVSEYFEITKYAERLSLSVVEFSAMEQELAKPCNAIENEMNELLRIRIERFRPDAIGITVPFPGNLLPALRCGQYVKDNFPGISTIMGGGYPTTELRQMTDKGIFAYFDYVVLDDGEAAMERIVKGGELIHTYTIEGYHEGECSVTHLQRGCPDFAGLPHGDYFSLCEVTNPMHRLWSDGRWNKMMLAHGCYWAKCAFCDTSLDYIKCYDTVPAATIVDWMEQVAAQTGSRGFHFVDEAAPPKLLKAISIEMLRRNSGFTWWTNIRFERAFTGDLCRLMADAGCIAVSGGLEVASDRLLKMIDKGITIEQATIAMRNFFYSGIMVHTYLMYGLPTETLQESVDALEVVRQMFNARLIDSAFWHRYAMTIHSRSGSEPEQFGVRRKGRMLNPFANNELFFSENRGYNVVQVGEGLRLSLANYIAGNGLDRPVHKWFDFKAPETTIENTFITDHLIKPDMCRIFDQHARLVWTGAEIRRTAEGIAVYDTSGMKELKLAAHDADFLVRIIDIAGDLNRTVSFAEAKEIYAEYSQEPFVFLYHSKKWDILRGYGLLQI